MNIKNLKTKNYIKTEFYNNESKIYLNLIIMIGIFDESYLLKMRTF